MSGTLGFPMMRVGLAHRAEFHSREFNMSTKILCANTTSYLDRGTYT
jgi:hypothetical protein